MGRKKTPIETPEGEALKKIRIARMMRNMSQRTVADAIGISQQAYSSYERGETSMGLDLLIKLPSVFDMSIADLLPDSIVTAVDQRRSRDFRLEKIVIGWPDLDDRQRNAMLENFELLIDAARANAQREKALKRHQKELPLD